MKTIIRNLVGTSVRYLIVLFAGWLIQRGVEVSDDQIRQWTDTVVGIVMILGTLAYSQYVRRKDQKNPDPAKQPEFKFKPDTFRPYAVLMLLIPTIAIVGCTADDAAKIENAALRLKAATTQPVAQVIVQAAPATGPIIGGIGAGAGVVAAIAAWFATRKRNPSTQ